MSELQAKKYCHIISQGDAAAHVQITSPSSHSVTACHTLTWTPSYLVQLLKCTHAFLVSTQTPRNDNYWPKYNNTKLCAVHCKVILELS